MYVAVYDEDITTHTAMVAEGHTSATMALCRNLAEIQAPIFW